MKRLKIAVMEGDDIGTEIVPVAKNVLLHSLKIMDIGIDIVELPVGKIAHAEYGDTFPEYTANELRKVNGIICGPIGHNSYPRNDPKWRFPPIRKQFELFASVRPIKSYTEDKNIDIIFVREVTEGLLSAETVLAGYPEFRPNNDITISSRVITRSGSERVARCAFDIANTINRKKVTAAHKEPVYRLSCGMFLEECVKVSKEYSDISFDDKLIDTIAMHLVNSPESFDVVVTTNQFGDILSDIGAGLIGSIGMAPGLCVGDNLAMAQTTHGSAPDISGKNISNPYATIMSAALLLSWMGFKYKDEKLVKASKLIEASTMSVLREKEFTTPDIGGNSSTQEMGEEIIRRLQRNTL
ncbi:MAG: isocitrate/isopropylmalate family dehydrogenase [Hyphomicrobiales bacterium]|nr:isocitrate/isopropylmalate family dehydrogenase [Hyphomicrobiales bacterium]|tara:strand:- start:2703 stop:3767 length:1065 start_codon:yes stop_codon:yes gene_type:complete